MSLNNKKEFNSTVGKDQQSCVILYIIDDEYELEHCLHTALELNLKRLRNPTEEGTGCAKFSLKAECGGQFEVAQRCVFRCSLRTGMGFCGRFI